LGSYTFCKVYIEAKYSPLVLTALSVMEASNIPSHVVYFIRKSYPNFKYRYYFELVQAIIYSGLRVIGGTLIFTKALSFSKDYTLISLCGSIYLMGIIWSHKLWKALLK
jgi:hypothetical protein